MYQLSQKHLETWWFYTLIIHVMCCVCKILQARTRPYICEEERQLKWKLHKPQDTKSNLIASRDKRHLHTHSYSIQAFNFADDNLVFCKANSVEWIRLMRNLGVYEVGSRQKLNLQKTSILFSRNTCAEKRQEILSFSGFSKAQRIDTYLGLPSYIGK